MESKAEYRVYGYRWVVLAIYLAVGTVMEIMWSTFFSITLDAGKYYGFADEIAATNAISLFSIIFMVGMIVLSVPSMALFEKIGFKKAVGLGAVLLAVGGLLRGFGGDSYTMVLVATVIFSIGQPFILNAVGLVAGKWFPESERALANGIGMLVTILGMIIGLVFVPMMLDGGMSIKGMLMVWGVVAAVVAVLFLLLAKEQPPTPPCAPEEYTREKFGAGLKALVKKPNFLLALIGYFMLLGVFNVFFTLIEPILKDFGGGNVDSLQIGVIGVIMLVLGTIGSFVLPIISDKSKGHIRKPFIIIGIAGGGLGMALVLFSHSFVMLAVACGLYGLLCIGASPVMMTFSAEAAFPTSEGTSEGMMLLAGNIGGALFLGLAGVFGSNYTGLMIGFVALFVVSLILMVVAKEPKNKEIAK